MSQPTMSFLPEDYLEKKLQRRTNFICFGLFCIVITAVVAAYLVTDRQRAEVQADLERVNGEFADAAKRLDQLEQLQQRKARMIRKAKVTASLLERVPRSLILAELVNNMPTSMTLLDATLDTKVVQPIAQPKNATALDAAKKDQAKKKAQEATEVETPSVEVTMQLVGIAPTDLQVAQYMTALSKRPLFLDVNLGFSEQVVVDQQTVRRFRVDLRLNNEVDTQKIEPLMVKREIQQNPMSNKLMVKPDGRLTSPMPSAPVQPANDFQRD